MSICFILTHIPNPRINKRISVAKQVGDVSVICVRRATQDIWEPFHTDIPHYTFPLNIPTSKEIVKRFLVGRKFSRLVYRKLLELQPDVLYVGGLDTLVIACKYKHKHKCRIVYEIADLREAFIAKKASLSTRLVRMWEKELINKVDLLIVTSTQFYEQHYRALVSQEKMLFLPNMPDLTAFTNYRKKNGGPFTVGFIGGIRYVEQLKMLVDASENCNLHVYFAGGGFSSAEYDELQRYCQNKEFVSFSGRYNYDREIADIYGKVDCVYAVYDADNPNVRLALPNKLYEAVYCELPIIVAKGTYLAQQVEEWGVGIAISHWDRAELTNVLKRLSGDPNYAVSLERKCHELKNTIDVGVGNSMLAERLCKLVQCSPVSPSGKR